MVTKKQNGSLWQTAFSGLMLVGLLTISIAMLWRHTKRSTDAIVHKNLVELQQIFQKIHKDCYITKFEHAQNYIDFLTVISFVGSQVGSMNLAFAKNWHGPYLKTNPTMYEKLYIVLSNKQGYFIVPGDGVVLDNGKVIGKDIVLDEKTDMRAMMANYDGLLSKVGALAVEIPVGSSTISQMMQSSDLFQAID